MNLLTISLDNISQIFLSGTAPFHEIDASLIFLAIFFILLSFIKTRKQSESERQDGVFVNATRYFAREEILPHLLKFEWAPIRKQKIGENIKEIEVVKHLKQLSKKKKDSMVVLSGDAGSGKTKLLYEFERSNKRNKCVFARWNLQNITPEQIAEEYKELPNSIKYIILDDVYRSPKQAVQFCFNLMPVREKFILAVRDRDELLQIIKDFRLHAESFILNKMENIRDLLEFNTEAWINSDVKQILVNIADGNPEVLSIGHGFIDQQCQDDLGFDAFAFLQDIPDKQSLFKSINNYILEKLGKAAIAVISRSVILNGLNRNDPFCKSNFKFYTKLRSLNYFYVQENTLFFKPIILGEYITSQYYFSKNKISTAFDNLIEDASEEEVQNILSTLIAFYKEQKFPIYKDAAALLLSSVRHKKLSENTILSLVLLCDDSLKDSKLIFDAIEDLLLINIETAKFDQINHFAIFCAKNKAYESAAKWWEKLLEIARLQNNDAWITALYNNLGLIYFNMENFDEAVEWYRLAHNKFKAMGNEAGIIQSLNNLALIYQKKNDWQQSIELYKTSIDVMKNIGDSRGVARTYTIVAQIYKSNNNIDHAFENYLQAEKWFEKSDDTKGLAQTYGNLGIISNSRKELDSAIKYFQKTLDGLEKVRDMRGIAQTSNNLALVYQEKGENDKTVKYFQLAIEKFKYFKDRESLGQTYNNLAFIYQKNENYDEARKFFLLALAEQEALDNNKAVAQTLNNLGLVYQASNEWEEAVDCYRKSIKFMGITETWEGAEQTFGNLGIALQALGQFDEAVKTYQNALERMDVIGDLDGMAQTYSNLGIAYYDLKKYEDAVSLLTQTLFFFLKQRSQENIKKVSSILSNIQKEMNNKKFGEIADSALNEIAKSGVQWGNHTALSRDETQDILNGLKKRKEERMVQE